MNIIFMGTPLFAVPSMESLINSKHNVAAVVTQPDRPKGRSGKLVESPIKKIAIQHKLRLFQPENINKDEKVFYLLKELQPDFIVTTAFGQILSKRILSIPKFDCINVHTSLLPKYRGAAPINRAIIGGEKETGISIIKMVEAMDAGDILEQCVEDILPDENAEELENRLSNLAAEPLLKVIDSFCENHVKYTPQNEDLVTFAGKLEKKDGVINWEWNKKNIHDLVRGLIPWPCAYSYLYKARSNEKRRLIIKRTCIDNECSIKENKPPGTINKISEKGLLVATKDSHIWVTVLQPEGKRAMDAKSFVNGYGIEINDYFKS